MTIPSPRKFLEITAGIIIALFFLAGFFFVLFVMAVFAMIEAVVDWVNLKLMRRRM